MKSQLRSSHPDATMLDGPEFLPKDVVVDLRALRLCKNCGYLLLTAMHAHAPPPRAFRPLGWC